MRDSFHPSSGCSCVNGLLRNKGLGVLIIGQPVFHSSTQHTGRAGRLPLADYAAEYAELMNLLGQFGAQHGRAQWRRAFQPGCLGSVPSQRRRAFGKGESPS